MTNSALDALKNKTADNAEPSEGWQVFNCAKQATTLVTPAGKRITFTGGRCLTKDADVIAYLDEVSHPELILSLKVILSLMKKLSTQISVCDLRFVKKRRLS